MIVGMHQVDNNQELSQNFAKDLENELNRLEHRVKQAKRFKLLRHPGGFPCPLDGEPYIAKIKSSFISLNLHNIT